MSVLNSFSSTAVPAPANDAWDVPNNGWKVTLKNSRGNKMTVPFYMGVGIPYCAPSTAEVLECLISDALGYRNAADSDDWITEYGYTIDSAAAYRAALKTFNACKRISERLDKFLTPEEFDALAYPEDAEDAADTENTEG